MTRPRTRARKLAAVTGLLAAALAAPAAAHERPSYASNISASGSRVAIQTTFGLIVGQWTDPTPGSWRWICPQAMGTIPIEDPATFMLDPDTVLMPGFDGLTIGTNDACDWSPAADALSSIQVFSGARSPTEPDVAYALTSSPQTPNAVYATRDGGRSWAPTSPPLSGAARYDSVLVAPSDPNRMYVGASTVSPVPSGPSTAVIFRSEDGGATWTSTTSAMNLGERAFRIWAVNPTDPDHVLASFGSAFSGRLVASTDGGRSFRDVVELASVDALAWRDDGAQVLVSGRNGAGVWRSTDGGQTFSQLRDDLDLLCLSYIEDELWGCGGIEVETQVTRSFDDGVTWVPVMTFETDLDVEVPCPASTTVGTMCPAAVNELREDFGLPPLSGGADAGASDGSTDAGPPHDGDVGGSPADAGPLAPEPARPAGGSGCTAAPGGPAEVALLALLALARARRRGRRADDA